MPNNSDTMAVATYNVRRWLAPEGRETPERALAVIRELNADVLALQEVALLHPPEGGSHYAHLREFRHDPPSYTEHLLGDALGMRVIPGPTMYRDNASYGNCLLTREEVLDVRGHDLSFEGREPRGVLDVELRVEGAPMRVMVTHLGLRPAERKAQVRRLRALLEERPDMPTLLLGDFNQWFPWRGALRHLVGWFGPSRRHRTFPAFAPVFPLDRIWVRPAHRLVSLAPHRSPATRRASDHLPLKAELLRQG